MAWGTVTIAGIPFREDLVATESGGTLSMRGQEAYPTGTKESARAARDNIIGFRGQIVPVVFSDKVELTGFYMVADASAELFVFANGTFITTGWSMSLQRIGTGRDVELETRLPSIARAEEIAGSYTPAFWHAAPPAAASYYTGSTVPGQAITRQSVDGLVQVYTGLPADVAPRWTCTAETYTAGRARVLVSGIERAGTDTPAGSSWELNNGIIRVASNGAGFDLQAWTAGAWKSLKTYFPAVSGANLSATPEFTILRNETGEVVVRLTYPGTPGRTAVDLSLRRGARFVTGVIKRHSAATLGVQRSAAEASTLSSGGMIATAVDADGNKALMLSTRLLGTTSTATPYISKAGVTVFDFALGYEAGNPAGAGNTFAELFLQYLGTVGDRTRVISR